jgi:putative NADH-flavin reductase
MKITRREALRRIGLLTGSLWFSSCAIPVRETLPPLDGVIEPKKNKTVALLGATGMAGGYILREALLRGYDVRALARTPAKLDAYKDRIAIIPGDARDHSAIQELLKGGDAVISALGPVKSDGHAANDICSIATGHIIQVMQHLTMQRYILLSGAAVTLPGDRRDLKGWLIRKLAQVALSGAVRDKAAEYELLEKSSIQWTLVRCPLINAEPYQRNAVATLDTPVSFHVRAGELARFVVEQIVAREYIRKGPFLGSL